MRYLCLAAGPLLAALVISSSATVQAQVPVGTVVGQSATDVHNRCSSTNNRVLAAAPDGSLWTLLYRDDGSSTNNRSMSLRYSVDAGATWLGNYPTPTAKPSSIGALAIDRRCNVLHVVWAAIDTGTYYNAYYQAFDIASKQWIGTHQNLAAGYSTNNHFYVQDVAVTPAGTVAVAVNGHRQGGYGLGGWGTGLIIKKITDRAFPPTSSTQRNLLQMNNNSGTGCNLQVWGEEIHCVFRDTPGGYGPAYSVFDTVGMRYTVKAVPCGPGNNTSPPAGGGSIVSFLIDKDGGKYILWPSGIVSNSKIAALRLAYAPPGKGSANADWTDTQVFNDPTSSPRGKKILGGNNSERWFTLSYAGGNNVNLVYSKPSEDWRNLYWEIWRDGKQVIGPVAPINSTIDDKFAWVSGLRNNESENAGTFLVWGERNPAATPPQSGMVTFWRLGSGGRGVSFGRPCQGTLPAAPRVRVAQVPAPNSALTISLDRNPASASCLLAIGTQCSLPALDLSFLGAPDCFIDINFPIIIGVSVNAQGELTIPWSVPGTIKVGDRYYVQNFVLAPGANSGGAVTSNALGLLF